MIRRSRSHGTKSSENHFMYVTEEEPDRSFWAGCVRPILGGSYGGSKHELYRFWGHAIQDPLSLRCER